jgi:transposase
MRELYWLSDAEWVRLEPLLPRGRRGAHRVDDRRVISGIMHMLHTGARWRDCPAAYGPYTTIYNRFNRWVDQLSPDPRTGRRPTDRSAFEGKADREQ